MKLRIPRCLWKFYLLMTNDPRYYVLDAADSELDRRKDRASQRKILRLYDAAKHADAEELRRVGVDCSTLTCMNVTDCAPVAPFDPLDYPMPHGMSYGAHTAANLVKEEIEEHGQAKSRGILHVVRIL